MAGIPIIGAVNTAEDYQQLGQRFGAMLDALQKQQGWSNDRMVFFLIAMLYGRAKREGWTLGRLTAQAFQWWHEQDQMRHKAMRRARNEEG